MSSENSARRNSNISTTPDQPLIDHISTRQQGFFLVHAGDTDLGSKVQANPEVQ